MDKDDLIRQLDRQIKIRTLQAFEDGDDPSVQDLERDFALAALDCIRRQPAMADLAGLAIEALLEANVAEPAVGAEN